jgi:hypothetical protein
MGMMEEKSMSIFLSRDEIKDLTGYVRAADQVRWLKSHRITHLVNAAGIPIVSRATIENVLGLPGTSSAPSEPNWGALRA